MIIPITAISAVVPSLLLMWYFHSRDLYREPAKVLWASFGLGVAIVVPVLLVAFPLAALVGGITQPYLRGAADAFLLAAIPEELFKFLVLYFYCARHKEFDEPMDGPVYGVATSLGFATLENVLYVSSGGLGLAIARALTAVPGHAFLGAIMGYFVGQARFGPRARPGVPLAALFWPILLHGLYDFPLMTLKALSATGRQVLAEQLALLGVVLVVLIVEWVWAVRLVKRLRREQQRLAPQQAAAPAAQQQAAPPLASHRGAPGAVQPGAAAAAGGPAVQGPRSTSVLGIVLMIVGAILASGGGLMTLGVVAAFAVGRLESDAVFGGIVVGGLLGLVPLILGLLAFRNGLRRVNAS